MKLRRSICRREKHSWKRKKKNWTKSKDKSQVSKKKNGGETNNIETKTKSQAYKEI
jgi:hypothetical protein